MEKKHADEVVAQPLVQSSESNQPQAPENPKRNAGGPRTDRGKGISRRNALKFGFFAKEIIVEGPDSKESHRDFLRLYRALADYWKPVGAAEILQVELALIQLFQLRRLFRVQRVLTVESNTLGTPELAWLQDTQFRETVEPADQEVTGTTAQASPISADPSRVENLPRALPLPVHLAWLQKCEAHIMRMYYRAVAELERMQQIRLGKGVPTHPVNKVKKR